MNQILHIFKKDIRHNWPETLLSLALLVLFTRHELHPWQNSYAPYGFNPFFFILTDRYAAPAMIAVWIFLLVRVLQGESLVGDRQWWVTKPYLWWNLLAAKIVFIFVFISVPLFHVQLLLLHHFGFPILQNFSVLLLTQVSLYLVLFLPVLLLASLTKSTGQFFLTIAGIVAVLFGIAWLATKVPSSGAENLPPIVEQLQTTLLWASVIAALVWQFARRRRWVSGGAFLGALAVYFLIGVLVPNAKIIEKKYPRVEAQTSPAKIALADPVDAAGARNPGPWPDAVPDINLYIPITVSGVAPGTMLMVDVMRITTDSAEHAKWTSGWKHQQVELWPEDQLKTLSYQVSRKEYEKIETKPLNLHIELALSEYQEADTRVLSLPPGTFVDETLGVCRLSAQLLSSTVQCLKPFHASGFMATVDAQQFSCPGNQKSYSDPQEAIFHAWESTNEYSFPEPMITPINEDSLWFRPVSLPTDSGTNSQLNNKSVSLCPGAKVRLARPELKGRFRIQMEMPNVRLEDLVGDLGRAIQKRYASTR